MQRPELGSFDWQLFLAVVASCAVGLLMVKSATFQDPALGSLVYRQAFWIVAGLAVLLVVLAVEYHTLAEFVVPAYLAAVLVLVYLIFFGRSIAGTRGWLELGPVNLQPSEFVKIILIMAIAAYASSTGGFKLGLGGVVKLALIAGVPLALILKEPDLGTAATLVPVVLVTALVAGIQVRVLVILLLVVALALPVGWIVYLKDYQKERILTFFDPGRDPSGTGYQVRQSKIAVGSGGLLGKGLFKGTQSQLEFLPARQTDFVFAVLAEEMGFLGAGGMVLLYFFITLRTLLAARLARDKLGRYIALGFGTMFGCQTLVNLGMVIGLVPIVGIPLPLMSYGGSSMVATLMGFGLVLNVKMRRFVN
ncbi:MAG: rod shape-determining protein RodA [Acidobacteriota bacterium]